MKQIIVCAAVRQNDLIVTGARHFDKIMNNIIRSLDGCMLLKNWEQGFIDQYGKFYNREDAYKLVQLNGQTFDTKRNTSKTKLYSEGLY